jgi:putative glutathione S-transferase
VTPDPVHPDFTHLRQIYFQQNPDYKGRFTVPTLYDKKQKRIVSNESADIIRMFYTAFDDLLEDKYKSESVDLLPEHLRGEIEEMNEWVYNDVNNGVYKSGFATYVSSPPLLFSPALAQSTSLPSSVILKHADIYKTEPKKHTTAP